MTTRKLRSRSVRRLLLLSLPFSAAFPASAQDTTVLSPSDTLLTDTLPLPVPLPEVAPPVNKLAAAYTALYLQKNERYLTAIRDRSALPFRIMTGELSALDLPCELKYLAVVESALKTTAHSRVGARGPWQLMPATARYLGLKVTASRDDRTHTARSTRAAARYLKELYELYGDWLLVIAAYNAGPGTVNKAIRYAGTRNFWRLQHALPAETRLHVKRYIAVHYFFEGTGGPTTRTKAEEAAYRQAVLAAAPKAPPAAAGEITATAIPGNR